MKGLSNGIYSAHIRKVVIEINAKPGCLNGTFTKNQKNSKKSENIRTAPEKFGKIANKLKSIFPIW